MKCKDVHLTRFYMTPKSILIYLHIKLPPLKSYHSNWLRMVELNDVYNHAKLKRTNQHTKAKTQLLSEESLSLAYKMNLESGPSDLMVSKLDKTYLWSIHKWEEEGEGDERKNLSVCFFPTCDLDSQVKTRSISVPEGGHKPWQEITILIHKVLSTVTGLGAKYHNCRDQHVTHMGPKCHICPRKAIVLLS